MTESKRIDMITHYKKLLFFAFERFEGENIYQIRPYFARIMMKDIEEFMPLSNKTVVDIGGARGEYCRILHEERNCHAVNLDPCPSWELKSEIHVHEPVWPQTVAGIAENIPFKDNKFDLVICRGVLEHVLPEKQQDSVNELYRITKKGGFCYIVIPPWYSPYAGHRLRPFHILPIKVAKLLKNPFLSEKIYAHSYDQLNMYKITFRNMVKMISSSNFNLVATKDTHLRLHFLTKIPLVRELAVPAVTFILKKE